MKRTLYALIGAVILLSLLLYAIAEAKENKPQPETPASLSPTTDELNRIVPRPTPEPTPEAPRPTKAPAPKKAVSAPKNPAPPAQSVGSVSGRHYPVEEVKALIIQYSARYGISPEAPLCIARLESGFNYLSANPRSSARGVYQYLSGTWKATDEGKAGLSVFDADANVRAAVKYMASRMNAVPWTVHPQCPPIKST